MMPDAPGQWMIELQMSRVDGSTILQKVFLQEGENTKGWSGQGKLHGISGNFKDREMLIGKNTFLGGTKHSRNQGTKAERDL